MLLCLTPICVWIWSNIWRKRIFGTISILGDSNYYSEFELCPTICYQSVVWCWKLILSKRRNWVLIVEWTGHQRNIKIFTWGRGQLYLFLILICDIIDTSQIVQRSSIIILVKLTMCGLVNKYWINSTELFHEIQNHSSNLPCVSNNELTIPLLHPFSKWRRVASEWETESESDASESRNFYLTATDKNNFHHKFGCCLHFVPIRSYIICIRIVHLEKLF